MSQHDPSPAAAVRRVLAAAGVTGAALALAAGAALPAYADNGHDGDDHGKSDATTSQSQSQSQAQSQSQSQGQSQSQSQSHRQDGAHPASKPTSKPTSKPSTHAPKDKDAHDPAGNNGTFFVKRGANDSHPGNQPHVSCAFYLSFFGFDKSQTLSVTFTGQAPTGKGQPVATTAPTTLTSTTPAGGAGNDYDGYLGVFDGSNLDLSKLGAPAKQGYHIKVDVATQQGGGHKYKVFWFAPCTSTPAAGSTSTTPGTTGSTTTPATTTTTTTAEAPEVEAGSTGGGATVEGLTVTRTTTAATATKATASTPTTVLGERVTRSPRTPQATGLSSLPFTGSNAALLAALGASALGGGAALTVAGRRRRAAGRA